MSWPATRTLIFAAVEASARDHLSAARARSARAPAPWTWSAGLHFVDAPPARHPATRWPVTSRRQPEPKQDD